MRVDPHLRPNDPAPLLHPHYQISSLLRAGPPRCAASVRSFLWRQPLEFLPWHQHDRFPRSPKEPETASRHLHTGHHPANQQAPAGLFPATQPKSRFRCHPFSISMLQQWFACARLTVSYLTSLTTPFPLTLTTPALYRSSLGWFKTSPCRAALEGLPPSLLELQHFQRPPFLLPCLVAHRLCENAKSENPSGKLPPIYYILRLENGLQWSVQVLTRPVIQRYPTCKKFKIVFTQPRSFAAIHGTKNYVR